MSGPRPTGGPPGLVAAAMLIAVLLGVTAWQAVRRTSLHPPPDMRLDLNAASPRTLAVLPGIGPGLAERIAADRAARGPFGSVRDLARVEGIGERTVERVTPFVVAGDLPLR